jgi:hypothetical protein
MIDYLASFVNTDGVAFPDTQAVNVTAPGAGDGTEFVELLVNDIWGRAQALLNYAGMTPDGVTEADGTAQFLTALARGYGIGPGMGVTYWKNGTPAANGDRVLLLQGQVISIASYALLVAACYVGDPSNPTAPAFYKTSDAGGTTRDTAGGFFVLPDTRALVLKGAGNQTINTRVKSGPAFGAVEEDRMQGHWHNYYYRDTGYTSGGVVGDGLGFVIDSGPLLDRVKGAITDGTNGDPRTGATTRDCSIGTNHGITY